MQTLRTATLVALAAAIGTASPALAQFGPNPFGRPQPDGWELYGPRILELLAAGVLGFAVGAFFSPLAKPLRRIIWLVAAAGAVLFALFGPFPIAMPWAGWSR